MAYFKLCYIDYNVPLEDVVTAVRLELNGPGAELVYRAVHKKIRELHNLNVPRNLVYDVMHHIDPAALARRGPVGRPRRGRRKEQFTSKGPNWTMSLDGHDKLCGHQKYTFPLCIYGALDTFSSYVHFLKIWTTNNDPNVIGRFYLEHLITTKKMPSRLRVDHGTETGTMTTIHCYLRNLHGDLDD
eukprot:gene19717-21663_t